ncbi:M28 family peptidase [uncultured Muriicola sp.]|uniref:M28 family metallopeptidase n=1 Tax=uncultured Muriicola sp. TaxID=1583102 RepID=UPI002624FDC9|nr:M28 family peptidase [uncultured Muriicola sp.]
MKRSLIFLFLVLLMACKATNRSPIAEEIDIANFSNATIIGDHMNFLASDALRGRDTGSEGIDLAASFIIDKLEENGIASYYKAYQDTLSNYESTAYNIVGVLEGNDPSLKEEVILVGAHYDHIGVIKSQNGDSIANGANDNASGTATVLELARYFAKARTNKRTMLFALFSAEEKGLKGSVHLAEKMKEDGVNLYAVLNFEMTGAPMTDKEYLVYATGFNKSNIGTVSNAYADENIVGFLPTAEGYNLFLRSDNYPFYEVFKIPAHTFSTFDFTNFDHYHKVGDEPGIMDFSHMASVVNKMIPVVQGITNASTKEIVLN